MTGCGCLLLVAAIVGLLGVMIFGSTDPGGPVEAALALLAVLALAAQLSGARSSRAAARS